MMPMSTSWHKTSSTLLCGRHTAVTQGRHRLDLGGHCLALLGRPERGTEVHVFEIFPASQALAVGRLNGPVKVTDEPGAVRMKSCRMSVDSQCL